MQLTCSYKYVGTLCVTIHIRTYLHIVQWYTFIYIHFIYIYIFMNLHFYIIIILHIYIFIYLYIYIFTFVYIYIFTYIHIYILYYLSHVCTALNLVTYTILYNRVSTIPVKFVSWEIFNSMHPNPFEEQLITYIMQIWW